MSNPGLFDALQDPYPSLNESDIRAVERELGLRFPDDYIQFLLKRNGGYFRHTAMLFPEHPVKDHTDGIEIRNFVSITSDPEDVDDLRSGTHLSPFFDETKPRHFIPIADAWFQDQFCLAGSGQEFGAVYLWAGEEGTNQRVAGSFSEFMQLIKLVDDQTSNLSEPEADKIPVFQAIQRGDIIAVEAYFAQGGDVNLCTARGTTLLMCAAQARWPKVLGLVLSHGPDLRSRDRAGRDPMWYVVASQSLEGTRLLLSAGGDVHSRDNNGEALLDILVGDRLYTLLEEHGAKPSTKPAEQKLRDV